MSRVERLAYRLINALLKAVLRSSLHPLFSEKVLLLTFAGRRSGRLYTVPLSYIGNGPSLVCFTCKSWSVWWKNLQGGTPVRIRLRGRELGGRALAITRGETMTENLGAFLSRYPATAYRYGVCLDASNLPDERDVIAAVELSDRVVMISIRPA